MKKRLSFLSFLIVLASGCCDCDELQSDEELRKRIIGTWVQEGCDYPFLDTKDITADANLLEQMTFNADGTITESGLHAYCCTTDCDTTQGSCTWVIENGEMTIIPDTPAIPYHLNQPYPIKCINDELLVFDNFVLSGVNRTKTCFRRQ
jgi:hypothetical protein